MATMQQIGRERVGLTSGRYNLTENPKSEVPNPKHSFQIENSKPETQPFRILHAEQQRRVSPLRARSTLFLSSSPCIAHREILFKVE